MKNINCLKYLADLQSKKNNLTKLKVCLNYHDLYQQNSLHNIKYVMNIDRCGEITFKSYEAGEKYLIPKDAMNASDFYLLLFNLTILNITPYINAYYYGQYYLNNLSISKDKKFLYLNVKQ